MEREEIILESMPTKGPSHYKILLFRVPKVLHCELPRRQYCFTSERCTFLHNVGNGNVSSMNCMVFGMTGTIDYHHFTFSKAYMDVIWK